MDVDTRLLRYFAAIAEEGNLTRAAHRPLVSQPSLTQQLKHLESQLGVRLFTRSNTGMTLTEAGHAHALVPSSTARFHSRPDIAYVPVTGVSPSEVAVAWLPDAQEAATDFARCCVDITRSRRTGCGTRSG